MYGQTNVRIDNAISDIKEKVEEINKVEQNVNTLLMMIQELHLILKNQTEIINSVDANMTLVLDHVESAKENIVKSAELFKSAKEVGLLEALVYAFCYGCVLCAFY